MQHILVLGHCHGQKQEPTARNFDASSLRKIVGISRASFLGCSPTATAPPPSRLYCCVFLKRSLACLLPPQEGDGVEEVPIFEIIMTTDDAQLPCPWSRFLLLPHHQEHILFHCIHVLFDATVWGCWNILYTEVFAPAPWCCRVFCKHLDATVWGCWNILYTEIFAPAPWCCRLFFSKINF